MRIVFCLIFSVLMAGFSFSQSLERFVVASAGDYFVNTQANVTLEFTVAEMSMVETFFANGFFLTQGFHQPEFKEVGIPETDIFEEFVVYPNPASEQVNIRYTLNEPGTLSFQLISMNGVLLYEQENHPYQGGQDQYQIELEQLSQGMYFVKATYISRDGNREISEFTKLSVLKH